MKHFLELLGLTMIILSIFPILLIFLVIVGGLFNGYL